MHILQPLALLLLLTDTQTLDTSAAARCVRHCEQYICSLYPSQCATCTQRLEDRDSAFLTAHALLRNPVELRPLLCAGVLPNYAFILL